MVELLSQLQSIIVHYGRELNCKTSSSCQWKTGLLHSFCETETNKKNILEQESSSWTEWFDSLIVRIAKKN